MNSKIVIPNECEEPVDSASAGRRIPHFLRPQVSRLKTKKTQNKPNFPTTKIHLNPFKKKCSAWVWPTLPRKNKPKRTQLTHSVTPDLIRGPERYPTGCRIKSGMTNSQTFSLYMNNLCLFVSIRGSKRQKMVMFWTNVASFWQTLASFGTSLASFGTALAAQLHPKTAFLTPRTQNNTFRQKKSVQSALYSGKVKSSPELINSCFFSLSRPISLSVR